MNDLEVEDLSTMETLFRAEGVWMGRLRLRRERSRRRGRGGRRSLQFSDGSRREALQERSCARGAIFASSGHSGTLCCLREQVAVSAGCEEDAFETSQNGL